MTTLNVSLTPALQATLGQAGVWAYAVYFDSSGSPVWATMVDNGSVQNAGELALALPETFVGGKVYFLIQSQDTSQPNDLETLITKESDINWGYAENWDFRYDSFEVTLQDAGADAGNLTSVNGFGLPMELGVTYSDGTTATRGYNETASDLFTAFSGIGDTQTVYTYTDGPLAGQNRIAISPSEAVGQMPANTAFAASDWDPYIGTFKVADPGVALAGFFNGAPDANGVWHNAGFFSYALEWDAADSVFWLNPTESSQIRGHIRITPGALANSIYSTLGDVGIYAERTDDDPYQIFHHAVNTGADSMNSGENNQWGVVLTQFLTGFTAGFYGTTGQSLNAEITQGIDLNENWNWDPSFAFGHNLQGDPSSLAQPFDPYSEIFFFNSNSYGSGYSDNLMKQYEEGGPLMSVSEPSGPDAGKNVTEINLTIYDDSETPSGYEQTVIYNYLDPGADGYEVPDSSSSPNNIKLNFANREMVLAQDTPISLEIYSGKDGNGDPLWQTVTFTVPEGGTLWQIWQLSEDNGTYSATAMGSDQGAGQMLITNFPVSGEAGDYWYRIHVGSGDQLKTFNLYTSMSGGGVSASQFLNPNNAANPGGSLAIDGLATISPQILPTNPETITAFTINFAYSGTMTVDPDLFVRNTSVSDTGTPNAPIAGTVAHDVFEALAGQTDRVSNTASSDEASVAFGWSGLNDAAGTASWIGAYTNKIGAQNVAEVHFLKDGHTVHAPLTARSDIDGQWQTHAKPLGNGSYIVTMQEHLSDGKHPGEAVGDKSSSLTLTVDTRKLALDADDDGDALVLVTDAEDDPGGNWLSLEVSDSTVTPGTSLILYATNSAGERVSRDGSQSGDDVTLDQATLATVGAAHADAGQQLLLGKQTLYLQTGMELHFAVVSGSGTIDPDADVTLTEQTGGVWEVVVGGFVLDVETDNTLSAGAALGDAQRDSNDALLYLQHGEVLDIDITGSTGNTNTLAFVRMDVDVLTGELSVDGVAYGATGSFRTAVLDHLDSGFSFRDGGNFSETESWTVAGEDGYYAPVLLTQNGNVFVVGDANPGGHEQIRMYGQNTFGFEDLTASQGSDFDYNDMVMRISPAEEALSASYRTASSGADEDGAGMYGPDTFGFVDLTDKQGAAGNHTAMFIPPLPVIGSGRPDLTQLGHLFAGGGVDPDLHGSTETPWDTLVEEPDIPEFGTFSLPSLPVIGTGWQSIEWFS